MKHAKALFALSALALALGGCGSDDDTKSPGSGGGSGSGGTGGAAGSSTGGTGGGSAGSGGGGMAGTGGMAGAAGSGGGLAVGQVDRMGRPGINTALIPSDKKDAYNKAPESSWATTYASDIEASLAAVDGLDGDATNGLLASQRSVLAGVIANDQLMIDISIDDCDGAYLALELQVPNKCGGRTLDEDVMDKTLQSLVDASGTTTVTDAIDQNDVAFSDAFPYLAAPH